MLKVRENVIAAKSAYFLKGPSSKQLRTRRGRELMGYEGSYGQGCVFLPDPRVNVY